MAITFPRTFGPLSGQIPLSYIDDNFNAINSSANLPNGIVFLDGLGNLPASVPIVIRGYISGLTLSTVGSSATMSISAGQATDSTNTVMMSVSAIAKTTSSWAVGTAAGGLDTGAIANSTWYHFYAIRRPDTGITDVCLSLSASAPTFGAAIPAAYTQYRRIGSGKTNVSGQWILFSQNGNLFTLATAVEDINVTNAGSTAVTRTLSSVPTGVQVLVNVMIKATSGVGSLYVTLTDLSGNDVSPTSYAQCTAVFGSFIGETSASVQTNATAQIRTRQSGTSAGDNFAVLTVSYIDNRGMV